MYDIAYLTELNMYYSELKSCELWNKGNLSIAEFRQFIFYRDLALYSFVLFYCHGGV